jgi:hypothetical protein
VDKFSAFPLVFPVHGQKLVRCEQPNGSRKRVKRVIRHTKTGEFFSQGTWTLSSTHAQDFPDTRELLTTCTEYQLRDVEVVLALGYESPGTYDVCVPLPVTD